MIYKMGGENRYDSRAAKFTQLNRQPKTGFGKLASFLYNSDTGLILGRTCKSWAEILAFYVVLYSFLAGFFLANMTLFLKTIGHQWPRYYGKGSIIGVNPGLGYQPWLKDDADSTLIEFDQYNVSSFKKYTDVLNLFWSNYNYSSSMKGLRECHRGQSNKDNVTDACIFHLDTFSTKGCGPPYFGFDQGAPCIVLTLNKLIAWEPVSYPDLSTPSALPPSVKENYNGDVAVVCEGEHFADQENIGHIEYIPPSGINKTFFPYKVMAKYHQPFAVIKFSGLKAGVLVSVECKAYAYNIQHNRASRLGMVHFEMYRRTTSPPIPAADDVKLLGQEEDTKLSIDDVIDDSSGSGDDG